jgi:hypothetical protein
MATDGFGNVYITGSSHIYAYSVYTGVRLSRGFDYTSTKYDSNGNQLWVRTYDGPKDKPSSDRATDVEVDNYGNIYVTGTSHGMAGGWDYTTIKYDRSGNESWVSRYEGPSLSKAHDMAVDVNGKVYVTGEHWGIGTRRDCVTVAYDSLGNQLWTARFDGPFSGFDAGLSIAADGSGFVYVVGNADESDQTCDFVTIKYVQTRPDEEMPTKTEE